MLRYLLRGVFVFECRVKVNREMVVSANERSLGPSGRLSYVGYYVLRIQSIFIDKISGDLCRRNIRKCSIEK